MRSLVIGAPNFVAMRLVDALLERGDDVRVLLEPGRDAASHPARRLAGGRAETRDVSLSDNSGLAGAAVGVDVLYYASWHYQDWGAEALADQSATRALRNVLAAATRARVSRLVYLSTTEVYGFPEAPARETEQLAPPGLPYADFRAEAEIAVWEHARRVKLPVTVLRPATVYGPEAPEFVVEVIEQLRRRRVYLVDHGEHVAGLTYVGNLVDAMVLAARAERSAGQSYNVTDGSNVTWAQYLTGLATLAELPPPTVSYSRGRAMLMVGFWERFYALLGRNERPPLTRLMVEMMGVDQRYPIDKARRDFGYRPEVSFERGLRETGDWMRKSGLVAQ
ncbi:MAG: NAD(P)-dependent oxidoreductase [Anaerolineae bacterium]